jgi:hypothetical protein
MKIPKRLTVRVNLDNVLKEHIYKGAKGNYLDLVLFNTPDNQFGNDYVVKQDIDKDKRPEVVPILGNARAWEPNGGDTNQMTGAPTQQAPTQQAPPNMNGQSNDGLPFS